MDNNSFRKVLSVIIAAIFTFSLVNTLFAQEPMLESEMNRGYIIDRELPETQQEEVVEREGFLAKLLPALSIDEEEELTYFQELARGYRAKGLASQEMGDIEEAMKLYQKAIVLDPAYAIVYNDLGIILEAKGLLDRAEQSYLRAVKLDPSLLSPYSNLALFYENKRQLEKALYYWRKRIELGPSGDHWTEMAVRRLEDLSWVIPSLRKKMIEQETARLAEQIEEEKRLQKQKEAQEAKKHLEALRKSARRYYKQGDYKNAIKEFNLVLSLKPQDKEAQELIDKANKILEKREKVSNIKKLRSHFQDGLRLYKEDNLQGAQQKFDKINELAASPQNN